MSDRKKGELDQLILMALVEMGAWSKENAPNMSEVQRVVNENASRYREILADSVKREAFWEKYKAFIPKEALEKHEGRPPKDS